MHIGYWWKSLKRQLGRPSCRWVDNIKMDLSEIKWDRMEWYGLD
jgi:hypothetical protein